MRELSSDKPRRRADIQRRTFLKGAGVALLLPRLESLGQVAGAESPRRLLTIVNHLSFYQPELIPQTDGAFENPPPLLAELSDHFDHLKSFQRVGQPGRAEWFRAHAMRGHSLRLLQQAAPQEPAVH